jgi:hypothetical protein
MKQGDYFQDENGNINVIVFHGTDSAATKAFQGAYSDIDVSIHSLKNDVSIATIVFDSEDEVDLFPFVHNFQGELHEVAIKLDHYNNSYNEAGNVLDSFDSIGYSVNYYLDAELTNLKKIYPNTYDEEGNLIKLKVLEEIKIISQAKKDALEYIIDNVTEVGQAEALLEGKTINSSGAEVTFTVVADKPVISILVDGRKIASSIPAFPVQAMPSKDHVEQGRYLHGKDVENGRTVVLDENGLDVIKGYDVIASSPTSNTVYLEDEKGRIIEASPTGLEFHASLSEMDKRLLANLLASEIENGMMVDKWVNMPAAVDMLYVIERSLLTGHTRRRTIEPKDVFAPAVKFLKEEGGYHEALIAKLEKAIDSKLAIDISSLNIDSDLLDLIQEKSDPTNTQTR